MLKKGKEHTGEFKERLENLMKWDGGRFSLIKGVLGRYPTLAEHRRSTRNASALLAAAQRESSAAPPRWRWVDDAATARQHQHQSTDTRHSPHQSSEGIGSQVLSGGGF